MGGVWIFSGTTQYYLNLFQEKKSKVFSESPVTANPALLNVDAEDGLYCPLQIRHLDLDFIPFQG